MRNKMLTGIPHPISIDHKPEQPLKRRKLLDATHRSNPNYDLYREVLGGRGFDAGIAENIPKLQAWLSGILSGKTVEDRNEIVWLVYQTHGWKAFPDKASFRRWYDSKDSYPWHRGVDKIGERRVERDWLLARWEARRPGRHFDSEAARRERDLDRFELDGYTKSTSLSDAKRMSVNTLDVTILSRGVLHYSNHRLEPDPSDSNLMTEREELTVHHTEEWVDSNARYVVRFPLMLVWERPSVFDKESSIALKGRCPPEPIREVRSVRQALCGTLHEEPTEATVLSPFHVVCSVMSNDFLFLGGRNGTIEVIRLSDWVVVKSFAGNPEDPSLYIQTMTLLESGGSTVLIAGTQGGELRKVRRRSHKTRWIDEGWATDHQRSGVNSVAVFAGTTLLTGGIDGLYVWNLESMRILGTVPNTLSRSGSDLTVYSISISDHRIYVGSWGHVVVLDSALVVLGTVDTPGIDCAITSLLHHGKTLKCFSERGCCTLTLG